MSAATQLFVVAPTYGQACDYVQALAEHPGRWRYYHPGDSWRLRGAGADPRVVDLTTPAP